MSSPHHNASTLNALSFLVLVVCSIPVFGTRFLNDMGFYALFADKLLSGGVLYRDAMDTKPPLVFFHYALVFKIFGLNNMTAVKIATMGWLGVSALVMVALRRALSPAAAVPALAAPLFILASVSGWGQDFLSSNTEILANLFILVGVWFLVARNIGYRPLYLIVGGGCIGVACLYRYQSGAALLAYVATILVRRREFDRKIARLLLVGAGFVLPGAGFVVYYAHIGALDDLRLFLTYQAHYMRDADDFYLPAALGQMLMPSPDCGRCCCWRCGRPPRLCESAPAHHGARCFSSWFAVCLGVHLLPRRPLVPSLLRPGHSPLVLLAAGRLSMRSLASSHPARGGKPGSRRAR